jgi:hypothetical protein
VGRNALLLALLLAVAFAMVYLGMYVICLRHFAFQLILCASSACTIPNAEHVLKLDTPVASLHLAAAAAAARHWKKEAHMWLVLASALPRVKAHLEAAGFTVQQGEGQDASGERLEWGGVRGSRQGVGDG